MTDTAANMPGSVLAPAPVKPSFWANIPANKGLLYGVLFCFGYVVLIKALAPFLPVIAFAPDTGFAHYYWKLPDPTFWSHFTAWTGYILHQVTVWGLIYWAQEKGLKYSDKLHPVNVAALAANAGFVLLHLLQTHYFYDGLAQDTHIFSSQGSVIVLLCMVLVMENQRRGLIAGKRAPFLQEAGRALRKYHGYIFSWAVTYTFWYHPMESNYGHLMGTLYTTLIMVQGSLFFTRIHTNKYWMVLMEVTVLFHGTVVALMLANGQWAQFFFGFLSMFVLTQMYGLGLPNWVRWAFWVFYVGSIVFVYQFVRGWEYVSEAFRVPAVLYALAFIIAFITWGILVVARALTLPKPATA
jgi:hypothetical protein